MKIVFSWDDGSPYDNKLFELHSRYNFPGMFFVPNRNSEGRAVLLPKEIQAADKRIVSFGGHTRDHVYLDTIPIDEVKDQIKDNLNYLEDLTDKKTEHFCLPGGKYNKAILRIAYSLCKTVRTADTMHFRNKRKPEKPSLHFYPRGVKSLIANGIKAGEYKLAMHLFFHNRKKTYFESLKDILLYEQKKSNDIVSIWGHSWEIEEYGLWDKLRDLFAFIKDNDLDVEDYNNLVGSYKE